MFDAIMPLDGARFDGYACIEECAPQGMLTLKGNMADPDIQGALETASLSPMPQQGQASGSVDLPVLWMAPDEVMILCPYAEVDSVMLTFAKAFAGKHTMLADASDGRALFLVTGAQATEVLSKLTPADMRADVFKPGHVRRTRLAQTPAILWCQTPERVLVMVSRSVAGYAFDILSNAAKPGSEL